MDMLAIDVNDIINNRGRNTMRSETAVNMSILLQTEMSGSHYVAGTRQWHIFLLYFWIYGSMLLLMLRPDLSVLSFQIYILVILYLLLKTP
jgi:uncharacterized membrane protein YwaF